MSPRVNWGLVFCPGNQLTHLRLSPGSQWGEGLTMQDPTRRGCPLPLPTRS